MDNDKVLGDVNGTTNGVDTRNRERWGGRAPADTRFMQTGDINDTRTDLLKFGEGERVVTLFGKIDVRNISAMVRAGDPDDENKIDGESVVVYAKPFGKASYSLRDGVKVGEDENTEARRRVGIIGAE